MMVTLYCRCGAGAWVDVEMREGETADDVRRDLTLTCPDCKAARAAGASAEPDERRWLQ
jgi:hypothetical protein